MKELIVHDAGNAPLYRILLEETFDGLVPLLHSLDVSERKLCLVSDSTVGALYGNEVGGILEKAGFCEVYAKRDLGNHDRMVVGKWR